MKQSVRLAGVIAERGASVVPVYSSLWGSVEFASRARGEVCLGACGADNSRPRLSHCLQYGPGACRDGCAPEGPL